MRVDILSGTRGIHAATKGASLPAPLEPPLAFLCSACSAGLALAALWAVLADIAMSLMAPPAVGGACFFSLKETCS